MLIFNCQSWSHITKANITSLEKLQLKFLKLILWLPMSTPNVFIYSLAANCRGGCNKWEWVEKVVAVKIYFKNRDKGGGKKCLKTFILVKYRNQ